MDPFWIFPYCLSFLRVFAICLVYFSPILLLFILLIALIGWYIGKLEKWTLFDSLYCAFITATKVGYGDMKPTRRRAKILAVVVAFLGLIFTGIVVTIGLHAGTYCIKKYNLIEKMEATEKLEDPGPP